MKRPLEPVFAIKGKRNNTRNREYVSTAQSRNFHGIFLRENRVYQCFQCEGSDIQMKNKILIGKPFKGKNFASHVPTFLSEDHIYGVKRVHKTPVTSNHRQHEYLKKDWK